MRYLFFFAIIMNSYASENLCLQKVKQRIKVPLSILELPQASKNQPLPKTLTKRLKNLSSGDFVKKRYEIYHDKAGDTYSYSKDPITSLEIEHELNDETRYADIKYIITFDQSGDFELFEEIHFFDKTKRPKKEMQHILKTKIEVNQYSEDCSLKRSEDIRLLSGSDLQVKEEYPETFSHYLEDKRSLEQDGLSIKGQAIEVGLPPSICNILQTQEVEEIEGCKAKKINLKISNLQNESLFGAKVLVVNDADRNYEIIDFGQTYWRTKVTEDAWNKAARTQR